MRRFYLPEIPDDEIFNLPEEESKHAVRVLRMKEGDQLLLLNGKGLLCTVEITEAHPKHCGVSVLSREQRPEPQPGFHLAIAPTKNMERMEWLVEKIVEIGATKLSFLQGDHSERVQLKTDRLERVAVSAMKQAEQDYLLEINPICKVDDFISRYPNGLIAHCMAGNKEAVGDSKITGPVLIGPEGDFSPREVELALRSGYKAVHLGQSRLRTETAGLVATVLAISKQA